MWSRLDRTVPVTDHSRYRPTLAVKVVKVVKVVKAVKAVKVVKDYDEKPDGTSSGSRESTGPSRQFRDTGHGGLGCPADEVQPGVLANVATHSTCLVMGNRSNARSEVSTKPCAPRYAQSRARATGSQAT